MTRFRSIRGTSGCAVSLLKSTYQLTYGAQGVAAAVHKGLTMSEAEKLERHQKLHKVVTTHTSHTWAAILVKMLLGQINSQNTARQTPWLSRAALEEKYRKAKKRLFLFDYDVSL